MKNKLKTVSVVLGVLFCAALSSCGNAQNTKKIAGAYDNKLFIFDDNTFIAADVNSFVIGTVEVNGNHIALIRHRAKQKFAVYGRTVRTRVYGNTIMFQGFEKGGLVNLEENNNPLKTMKRVFNVDANCVDYPNLYDNTEDSKAIYFADETDSQLYKFEVPKGFRDFVAFRFDVGDDPNLFEPIVAKVSDDFNSISFGEEGKKITKKPLTKEILETKKMVMAMYERAYPEGKYYYCNPAYNIFEEQGIDISNYEEYSYKGDGEFKLKGSNIYPPGGEKRLEFDFHSNEIIYRYERIEPKLVAKTNYTIEPKSIFTFVCETER